MLLCSEYFVISLLGSSCFSWDPLFEDDLGRATLFGGGATVGASHNYEGHVNSSHPWRIHPFSQCLDKGMYMRCCKWVHCHPCPSHRLAARSLHGWWLQQMFMHIRLDRPRATVVEVVLVHTDEADSPLDPTKITNENPTGMRCCNVAGVASCYKLRSTNCIACCANTRL